MRVTRWFAMVAAAVVVLAGVGTASAIDTGTDGPSLADLQAELSCPDLVLRAQVELGVAVPGGLSEPVDALVAFLGLSAVTDLPGAVAVTEAGADHIVVVVGDADGGVMSADVLWHEDSWLVQDLAMCSEDVAPPVETFPPALPQPAGPAVPGAGPSLPATPPIAPGL